MSFLDDGSEDSSPTSAYFELFNALAGSLFLFCVLMQMYFITATSDKYLPPKASFVSASALVHLIFTRASFFLHLH